MIQILQGHVLDKLRDVPSNSIHCIVTSPPYWGLRKYGDWRMQTVWGDPKQFAPPRHPQKQKLHLQLLKMRAERTGIVWAGEPQQFGYRAHICALGLEPEMEMFIGHMVEIFAELHRVLRKDGTCWLNLGDSYIADGGHADNKCNDRRGAYNLGNRPEHNRRDFRTRGNGTLKPKDLCFMPHRVAIALQEWGWYVRSDIVWHKPNPMPESVTDRPTKSHEYIFLLTKSDDYFYDSEAIKETSSENSHPRGSRVNPKAHGPNSRMNKSRGPRGDAQKPFPSLWQTKQNASFSAAVTELVPNRNKRDVWTITTEAFKGAHFATFPTEIPRTCILAGTSAKGCCRHCGKPWVRVIEKGAPDLAHQLACGGDINGQYHGKATKDFASHKAQNASEVKARILQGMVERKTTGWKPACDCGKHLQNRDPKIAGRNLQLTMRQNREQGVGTHDNPFPPKQTTGWQPDCDCASDPIPCTVLDPFGGSGTTAQVAIELGRKAVTIELNQEYLPLIKHRTNTTPGLPLA